MNLFSIGEFSRLSGLPIRTLRFYHEKGLLVPARVEGETGYRFYSQRELEVAHVIRSLRDLEFGLDTIAEILAARQDEGDIGDFLVQQKQRIEAEIQHRTDIVQVLESILLHGDDTREAMTNENYGVEEKDLPSMWVAGIRMRGRYSDCGKVFGKLCRKFGRPMVGKPMMLYYDEEYREEDADFEPCVPLKKSLESDVASVRELPGGRCLSLVHKGPYDQLMKSYRRIFEHATSNNIKLTAPSREVYLKGPGMIFKGNPERYLTEIQFLFAGE
jgi:DNA-binding transcriptional MerR regulator/effector-binding domain-containing protein